MLKIEKISLEGIERIESALSIILSDLVLSETYVNDPAKVVAQFDLTPDEKALLATRKRVALEEAGVNMRKFISCSGGVMRDNGFKITPNVAMSIPNKAKLFGNVA